MDTHRPLYLIDLFLSMRRKIWCFIKTRFISSAKQVEQAVEREAACSALHRSKLLKMQSGDVAQLVRALPCHGRGRGFEPRRPRHTFQKTYGIYGT
jgi:hypothetical protein